MADIEESEAPTTSSSVGERLRLAREEKGLSLEDIAGQTRIPLRHLEAIEEGDWDRLPAPTYTIGFAKSYASAVDLDRNEVAEDIRTEIGGTRPAVVTSNEVFEPADPARTMPRWLVIGAVLAILVVVLALTWLNSRALEEPEETPVAAVEDGPAPDPAQPQQERPAATGPVVLTANAPAWIRVTDQGRILFEGVLQSGQRYEVPAGASAPELRAGAPEALRVTVGDTVVPPVGPPGRVASNVSLRAADLLGEGAGQPTIPAPSAPPGISNRAG